MRLRCRKARSGRETFADQERNQCQRQERRRRPDCRTIVPKAKQLDFRLPPAAQPVQPRETQSRFILQSQVHKKPGQIQTQVQMAFEEASRPHGKILLVFRYP